MYVECRCIIYIIYDIYTYIVKQNNIIMCVYISFYFGVQMGKSVFV